MPRRPAIARQAPRQVVALPPRWMRSGSAGSRLRLWENKTDGGGVNHRVTFRRLYRGYGGAWKSTSSFRAHDLLLLAKVADAAHTRLLELRRDDGEGDGEGDGE